MRWTSLFLIVLLTVLSGCAGSGKPRREVKTGQPSASAPAPAQAPSWSGSAAAPQAAVPKPQPAPADMYYRNYGVNPAVPTARDSVSTFAIDVDTASYTLTRSYLERGMLPPPEAVRPEEFINYFPQHYTAPANRPVAVHLDGAASPFREGWHLLKVGLKAREVRRQEQLPSVLTFVIDISGSMNMENRLGLVKRSLSLLLDQLQSGDMVGVVVYGTRGRVLLEHTSDKARVRAAIERLTPEGSTNAEEGLMLGYDLAYRGFREGATNRVILCSDGVANVGRTGPEAILQQVSEYRDKGITLTTVGFGMGNYNDALMEQLANKGDGQYAYVDTLEEARKLFVEELSGTLELVARDAKVQVRFDPTEVAGFRLVGYENRALQKEEFRNEQVDGGEMGAGHSVTALYELQLHPGRAGSEIGRVAVRFKDPANGEVLEIDQPIGRKLVTRSWSAATPQLRWTAAVAEFASVLKQNPWSIESSLEQVYSVARRAGDELDATPQHQEFLMAVNQALRLKGRR